MLKVTLLKPIPAILLSKNISYYHFISYRSITINGYYLVENQPVIVPDQYIENDQVKFLMSRGFLAIEKIEEQSQEIQTQAENIQVESSIELPTEPIAENVTETIDQPVQEDTSKIPEEVPQKKQRRKKQTISE
jgi:hypothetical protein